MDNEEMKKMIESIVRETMGKKPADSKACPACEAEDGEVPDIRAIPLNEQYYLDNAKDEEALREMRKITAARV